MSSWLAEGIDVTVCRHSFLNQRATNKGSVRNRATNKSGGGRKRAKVGDQSIKVEWASDTGGVDRLREFGWKIERGSRLFNIMEDLGRASIFISPMHQLSPLVQGATLD